jgi:alcohol oxidase
MLESGRYVFDAPRGNLTEKCVPLDCSITPGNVGANTYNTSVGIGEKAAVLIAEDLGIRAP